MIFVVHVKGINKNTFTLFTFANVIRFHPIVLVFTPHVFRRLDTGKFL